MQVRIELLMGGYYCKSDTSNTTVDMIFYKILSPGKCSCSVLYTTEKKGTGKQQASNTKNL